MHLPPPLKLRRSFIPWDTSFLHPQLELKQNCNGMLRQFLKKINFFFFKLLKGGKVNGIDLKVETEYYIIYLIPQTHKHKNF